MISSLAIIVGLCGVVISQESKLAKFADRKKAYEEDLEEAESGYPLIVQQPLPIIIEKRIPYDAERYDFHAHPSVNTPLGEEFAYRPEVVRSPIIFTVGSQPAFSRIPYPLRVQQETWPLPCPLENPNCLNEEYNNPVKRPAKKKNTYKSGDVVKERNIKVNQRDATFSSDFEKGGSVQHRETFQTPILIALEKPGYRYVKHLVGEGVLPKARQFHVLILEEDVSTDNPNNSELNDRNNEQEVLPEKLSTEDILNNNKQEENGKENREIKEISTEGSISTDSKNISPSTTEESKIGNKESPSKYDIKGKTEPDMSYVQVSSEGPMVYIQKK